MKYLLPKRIKIKTVYYNCLACVLGCGIILFLYAIGFLRSGFEPNTKDLRISILTNNQQVDHNGQAKRLHVHKPAPTLPDQAPHMNINQNTDLRDEVTLVTAYFNLGTFQKGEISGINFSPRQYRTWMRIFKNIKNPVIAYFDSESDAKYFSQLRREELHPNITQVEKISREDLWSFSLREAISAIYRDPDYPVHHPNTVDANYSCAMHAKYELVYQTVIRNPFKTKYFAWIDIGLFRDLDAAKESAFELYLPEDFNSETIAYTDVWRGFQPNLSDDVIFKGNFVWVCGCFFVGRIDAMVNWTLEYLQYTNYFVNKKLMNSDQQVLFAMFSNYSPRVNLQTYFRHNNNYNEWFYLAYLCKEQGLKRIKQRT